MKKAKLVSKADLSFMLCQKLLEKLKNGDLKEIYEKAEAICSGCKLKLKD